MLRLAQVSLAVLIACSVARAESINITVGNFDPAPTNTVGTGDFKSVVEAAAAVWEDILPLPYDLNITIGWSASAPFAGGFNRNASFVYDAQGRIISSEIFFNNATGWFLDPTPSLSEEYRLPLNTGTYGPYPINVDRSMYARLDSPALPTPTQGHDLLSIAVHEIGHSLNILGFGNGVLPITMGPYAGEDIPVLARGGGHIDVGTSGMYGLQHTNGAHRVFPTEIDIAAMLELTPGLGDTYLYDVLSTAAEVSPGMWRYDYTVINYPVSTYDITILGVGRGGSLMTNVLSGGPLGPGGTRTVGFFSPFAPTSGTAGVRFADGASRSYHAPVLVPIPEPVGLALLGVALVVLRWVRRR